MEEAEPTVTIFVGRTVGGFIKFLKENNIDVIEPEILADYVLRAIKSYEKGDLEASNRLINEIWDLVGAKDPDIAVEVTRQFGKLCDMTRSVLQKITGKENISEEMERDI